MEALPMLQALGLSLLLGLLVGLQRERASPGTIAGIRTFALITLFGGVCGAMVGAVGEWIVAGGLLAVAALIVVGNRARDAAGNPGHGVTTEVAMLVMFAVGALLTLDNPAIGVCVGGVTAIMLHLKPQLHSFAEKLEPREFHAIMQFALVSAVILPVLPDEAYDKYGALNPRHIWLMVTLITGMSLAGYLAHKLIGQKRGAMVAGALGGLISSTATAATFARRGASGMAPLAAAVIGIACAIMYVRILIEIGAVAPSMLASAAPVLGIMAAATIGGAAVAWLRAGKGKDAGATPHGNPAELKTALIFGASYALIALVAAVAKERLGAGALYGVAAVSGATEMDAITLSIARMAKTGEVEPGNAWRYVVVGAMSNTAFKWGIGGVLGGRTLFVSLAPALGASLLAGAAALLFWPG